MRAAEPWEDRGRCARQPTWLEDRTLTEQRVECWACPVRRRCLQAALEVEQGTDLWLVSKHVIYGGLDGRERSALIRERRRRQAG